VIHISRYREDFLTKTSQSAWSSSAVSSNSGLEATRSDHSGGRRVQAGVEYLLDEETFISSYNIVFFVS